MIASIAGREQGSIIATLFALCIALCFSSNAFAAETNYHTGTWDAYDYDDLYLGEFEGEDLIGTNYYQLIIEEVGQGLLIQIPKLGLEFGPARVVDGRLEAMGRANKRYFNPGKKLYEGWVRIALNFSPDSVHPEIISSFSGTLRYETILTRKKVKGKLEENLHVRRINEIVKAEAVAAEVANQELQQSFPIRLHPHPLGLEGAQTGYRGARHGCSRPRRSPIPAFATRVPATFPAMMRPAPPTWRKPEETALPARTAHGGRAVPL